MAEQPTVRVERNCDPTNLGGNFPVCPLRSLSVDGETRSKEDAWGPCGVTSAEMARFAAGCETPYPRYQGRKLYPARKLKTDGREHELGGGISGRRPVPVAQRNFISFARTCPNFSSTDRRPAMTSQLAKNQKQPRQYLNGGWTRHAPASMQCGRELKRSGTLKLDLIPCGVDGMWPKHSGTHLNVRFTVLLKTGRSCAG